MNSLKTTLTSRPRQAGIVLWATLAVFGPMLQSCDIAHAHPVDWRKTNHAFFSGCYDPKTWDMDSMNPAVLMPPCTFARILSLGRVRVIDGCRDLRSYHHGCTALDFYLDDYSGMSRCEKIQTWLRRFRQFKRFLDASRLTGRVGLGAYPFNQFTPSIHLDTRGYSAYWARRQDKTYVYFKNFSAMDSWLDDKTNDC